MADLPSEHALTTLVDLIARRETSGYIELRWAPVGQAFRQEWHRCNDRGRTNAANMALRLGTLGDVFIGCAPRRDQGHGGRSNIDRAWCLWVDCDDEQSAARLREYQPQPTLTIASGTPGRLHGWWSLTTAAPARYIEQANRRLAHHLGADPRCAEAARILRPPLTRNHKHDPPTVVEVVARGPARHPVAMVADLPDPPMRRPAGAPAPPRRPSDDPLLGISAQEYIPRLTGRDVDGKGFVQCPLHEDWRPSLRAYADPKRGFYCFQCDWGGTVYDFAAALWDMPTRGPAFTELKDRLERTLL